mmetsp:Transcript_5618/g.18255  ORF Transcript_5618/g.18255 Transcript_5618/m.18255 type:complete len:334 (+) Transcript_5618:542-1543(+)
MLRSANSDDMCDGAYGSTTGASTSVAVDDEDEDEDVVVVVFALRCEVELAGVAATGAGADVDDAGGSLDTRAGGARGASGVRPSGRIASEEKLVVESAAACAARSDAALMSVVSSQKISKPRPSPSLVLPAVPARAAPADVVTDPPNRPLPKRPPVLVLVLAMLLLEPPPSLADESGSRCAVRSVVVSAANMAMTSFIACSVCRVTPHASSTKGASPVSPSRSPRSVVSPPPRPMLRRDLARSDRVLDPPLAMDDARRLPGSTDRRRITSGRVVSSSSSKSSGCEEVLFARGGVVGSACATWAAEEGGGCWSGKEDRVISMVVVCSVAPSASG